MCMEELVLIERLDLMTASAPHNIPDLIVKVNTITAIVTAFIAMLICYLLHGYLHKYSKNSHVRTCIFPSLVKQVLIFGGSYWQFRLK